MKKNKIMFFLVLTHMFLAQKKINLDEINAQIVSDDKSGIGYCFNVAKDKYLDATEIKTGAPIFESDFLQNQINNAIKVNVNHTSYVSISSNSFNDIVASLNMEKSFDYSFSGNINCFSSSLDYGFYSGTQLDYRNALSQYFYNFNYVSQRYTYNLPEYANNLDLYRNNLSDIYIEDVVDVLTDVKSHYDFFDTYGTHLIVKAIYGGKLDVYYSAISTVADIGIKFKNDFDTQLTNGITGVINNSQSMSNGVSIIFNGSNVDFTEKTKIVAYGGESFPIINFSSLNSNFSSWSDSISDNVAIIGTPNDGLIPLWELLPSDYNTEYYKTKLGQLFDDYLSNSNYTNSQNYENYGFPDNLEVSSIVTKRPSSEDARTITDDGRFAHNVFDTFDFTNDFLFGYNLMKDKGYTKFDVAVTINMKEVDSGYQYVMLYNEEYDSNDFLISEGIQYSYGGSTKKTTYSPVVFCFNDINLEYFPYNKLVIRYGASGDNDDDWKNYGVSVKLTYKRG